MIAATTITPIATPVPIPIPTQPEIPIHDDLRLLLIDDDIGLCGILNDFFASRGFLVECQHDGRRGLTRVLEGGHHMVLLDAMLPGLDGLELLRQVRRRSLVPVIMVTARDERQDRIAGLEAGADDYVHKPFGPDELLARIRAVLRRSGLPQGTSAPRLTSGGVVLDPGSREVFLDGEPVRMTSIEYDVLEYLMRAAGRVVSRDELMTVVCQREATPFDRSLDVHVSHVRKKLDERRALIRTVRGVGYLFCAGSQESA